MKTLAVQTPAAHDALVAEVQLCSRFQCCDRVVRLLGACLRRPGQARPVLGRVGR